MSGRWSDKRSPRRWTQSERDAVVRLRDDDLMFFSVIAKRFAGATAKGCSAVYQHEHARRRVVTQVKGPTVDQTPAVNFHAPGPKILDAVQSEREHRAELRRMRDDVTANFFGDPLPGYSALDKARARP